MNFSPYLEFKKRVYLTTAEHVFDKKLRSDLTNPTVLIRVPSPEKNKADPVTRLSQTYFKRKNIYWEKDKLIDMAAIPLILPKNIQNKTRIKVVEKNIGTRNLI